MLGAIHIGNKGSALLGFCFAAQFAKDINSCNISLCCLNFGFRAIEVMTSPALHSCIQISILEMQSLVTAGNLDQILEVLH